MAAPEPPSSGAGARHWQIAAILFASCTVLPALVTGELARYVAGDLAAEGDFTKLTEPEQAVFCGLILIGGACAMRYGAKAVALLGLASMTAAGIGCAAAQTPLQFLLALLTLNGGGALALPALLTWALARIDRRRWGALLFPWCALLMLIRPNLPALHGLVVDTFSWRIDYLLLAGVLAVGTLVLVRVPGGAPPARASSVVEVFGDTRVAVPDHGQARTSVLPVAAAALGLTLVLIAANLAMSAAMRATSGAIFLLLALSVSAVAIVALTGLVADRWGSWLRAGSAVALAVCCASLAATLGQLRGAVGDMAFAATYATASIATIAQVVALLQAGHGRLAVASAAFAVLYLLSAAITPSLVPWLATSGESLFVGMAGFAADLAGAAALVTLVAAWRAHAAQKSVASPFTSQSP